MSTQQVPAKRRPRKVWFAVGALLMVVGIVVGVAVIVHGVRSVLVEDGVVAADGQPHTVTSPTGEKRMVFRTSGAPAPSCTFVDGSGADLRVRADFGSATVTNGDDAWEAFATLDDAGDGTVTATCTSSATGTNVRIGAPVTVGGIGLSVGIGLASLLGLGGIGFVVLLVTTILWITRQPADPKT
ncbi:MAG: hypothetical protein JWO46_3342 [Nocardioidaceae bacterium]|nr:hypothetical protein [Nocardioidaceae bacterium]